MPATMTYKDRDLRYRRINRRMQEFARPLIDIDGLIGRTWSEVVGPETASAVENEDRRVMATGEPVSMEQGWAGPDGRKTIIWAIKVPLRDADSTVQGIIPCGIDIPRLKETEVQLIEQREVRRRYNAQSQQGRAPPLLSRNADDPPLRGEGGPALRHGA